MSLPIVSGGDNKNSRRTDSGRQKQIKMDQNGQRMAQKEVNIKEVEIKAASTGKVRRNKLPKSQWAAIRIALERQQAFATRVVNENPAGRKEDEPLVAVTLSIHSPPRQFAFHCNYDKIVSIIVTIYVGCLLFFRNEIFLTTRNGVDSSVALL